MHLEGDLWRVFYSTRDVSQRNRVGSVDLALGGDSVRLVAVSGEPVLDVGDTGHFDCDGVYGSSIVVEGDVVRLYYGGWFAGRDGLFTSAIGLAESSDWGVTFNRVRSAPILGRDELDPWACMAPFVLPLPGGYRMWYSSGLSVQRLAEGGISSRYDVKVAHSKDGVLWEKSGETAIPLLDSATNIARACVNETPAGFIAWYPYVPKGESDYRIGFARSADGLRFDRLDSAREARVPRRSAKSFDSRAQTYPYVLIHQSRKYLLYNGDGFGETGFSIALWEET